MSNNKAASTLLATEEEITQKYLNIVLPSLTGEEGGEVDTFTHNGKVAYKFPCPHCQSFYDNQEIRNKQMGELFQDQQMQYSSSSWSFRCRRRGSPECRGGTKSFYNFLAIYDPDLFDSYKKEIDVMFKMQT
tara:strand:- start:231 stop:626 length:396 start_codon:yes stop_codon:yes gene_type:complete